MPWTRGMCVLASCTLLVACSTRKEPAPRAAQREVAQGSETASANRPSLPTPGVASEPPRVPRIEALELGRSADQKRLERDVKAIAHPRVPGGAGWRQAQLLIAKRLTDLGFDLERHNYGTGT